MHINSLGYQTDLALLRLGGSEIEDRGDHIAVRSPHNPGHWWGNFLLLQSPPTAEDTDHWLKAFANEFPEANHIALGFDGVDGSADDLSPFRNRGLSVEGQAVMTATTVHEPPRPNRDAKYRALSSDKDWEQLIELRMSCIGEGLDAQSYHDFTVAKVATVRRLVESGHGAWFGAFKDDRLLSGMGLFHAGEGLARFQSVETRPDARDRGLAGTLVHHVSAYGFTELRARTLVMVADPQYLAIRVYRSVGFAETETQLQAEKPPNSHT
ncbi:GNAT family N-acetyltransferase [Micromonospora sp. NPDC051296]|uniref:GNAT family N-acetyltransferase n=1 Tax=Micromonospora sp. NPDC051296 TaxID=3155046 RepID=UPI00343A39FC